MKNHLQPSGFVKWYPKQITLKGWNLPTHQFSGDSETRAVFSITWRLSWPFSNGLVVFFPNIQVLCHTPLKINIEPENDGLVQMIFLFQGARILRFQPLIFQKVYTKIPSAFFCWGFHFAARAVPPTWDLGDPSRRHSGRTRLNFLKAKPNRESIGCFLQNKIWASPKNWLSIYIFIYQY